MTLLTNFKHAFSYRDFKLIWIGELISATGTEMMYVAVAWQLYELTNSPISLGLIGLFRFLPVFFLSLVGGMIADSHNRKKTLFITQSCIACASLILCIATWTDTISPFLMYTAVTLVAASVAFDLPARGAFIPNLVEKKDLATAMSVYNILWNSAKIAGPSLGGIAIASIGLAPIYAIDFISTLCVIGALVAIKHSGEPQGIKGDISFSAIKEGIHFVFSKTILWSTMILDFFATFFSSAMALLPIFAKTILHVGPVELGLLYAGPSIGAVLCGFLFVHFAHRITNHGGLLLTAVGLYAGATILFGLSTLFIVSFIALIIVGGADSISAVVRDVIHQYATSDHLRGRMESVNMLFFMGGPQLGEVEAGFLAALIGAPFSVVIGGIGTFLALGIMAIKIPQLRRYNAHTQ